MGFLDRFFKPKTTEKEVNLRDLKDYSEELLKGKFLNINEKVDEISSNIEETKRRLKRNLESLKTAELQNGKLPTRVIQLMQGNRDAYVKKLLNFIEDISLPGIESYLEINEFCTNFNKKLDDLNKATFKGYEIMKEFFYNQATDIAMGIKGIDTNIQNLKKVLENKELSKIEHLRRIINKIEEYDENKRRVKDSIQEHIYTIKELEQKIDSVKRKFEEIKESKEFEDYKRTSKEKEELIEKIRLEKDKIIQNFAVLEKSLKKYKRDSLNEKLIDDYLDDPSEAMLKDTESNIISVLEKLKEAIERNKLDLKDKKKKKSLEIINRLNKDFLSDVKNNLEQLVRSKIILNERLRKNNVNNKYQEEKYRLEHYIKKLEEKDKRLEELKEEEENLDIEKVKEDIKKEFIELFSIRLIIS